MRSVVHFVVVVAVGSLVSLPVARAQLASESFVEALVGQLERGSAPVKERAAEQLGRLGTAAGEAVPALIAALEIDSPALRVRVSGALTAIGPSAVPALAEALATPDPQRDLWVITALGDLGVEARPAADALVSALSRSDPTIRAEAVWALGRLEDPALTPALIAALDDENGEVATRAARALGRLETPTALDALVGALSSDREELRAAAARGLSCAPSIPEVSSERLIRTFEAMPAGPSRTLAARALAQLPTVPPELCYELLTSTSDPIAGAGFALVQRLEPEAAVALVLRLLDPREASFSRVARVCDIVGAAAVPALTEAVTTGSARRRARAASLLARFGSRAEPAVPALIGALTEDDRRLRNASIRALGAIGPGAAPAAHPLGSLLQLDRPPRTLILNALAQIGPAAAPSLAENLPRLCGLDDARPLTSRDRAVETLREWSLDLEDAFVLLGGDPSASCRAGLTAEDARVRLASALAFEIVRDIDAADTDALRSALHRELLPVVRVAIATALTWSRADPASTGPEVMAVLRGHRRRAEMLIRMGWRAVEACHEDAALLDTIRWIGRRAESFPTDDPRANLAILAAQEYRSRRLFRRTRTFELDDLRWIVANQVRPVSRDLIVDALEADLELVGTWAAWSLLALGDDGPSVAVDSLLSDNVNRRRRAEWALELLGPPVSAHEDGRAELWRRWRLLVDGIGSGAGSEPRTFDTSFLAEALAHESPEVRAIAAWCVGVSPEFLLGDWMAPALARRLDDEDSRVRSFACRALARTGELRRADRLRQVVDALVRAVRHDSDAAVRAAACAALAVHASRAIRVGHVEGVLRRHALVDANGVVRAEAALAIWRLSRDAKPDLVSALTSAVEEQAAVELPRGSVTLSDPDVRARAIVALGEMGPEAAAALPTLMRVIEDERWDHLVLARRAVERISRRDRR